MDKDSEQYQAQLKRNRERARLRVIAKQEALHRERGIVVGQNKLCRGCDTVKDLDQFNRMTQRPDGRRSRCRECTKAQHFLPEVRARRLEQMREYGEKYREDPEKRREYHRTYYLKNREKILAYHHTYYLKNREKYLEYARAYYHRRKAEKAAESAGMDCE